MELINAHNKKKADTKDINAMHLVNTKDINAIAFSELLW
jgi:hypothetical protein